MFGTMNTTMKHGTGVVGVDGSTGGDAPQAGAPLVPLARDVRLSRPGPMGPSVEEGQGLVPLS